MDPLNPGTSLLAKLGSFIYHAEEAIEDGHEFDMAALRSLVSDPEVIEWLDSMRKMALLPVKRS